MKTANEIVESINKKRLSVEKTTNFLALNPMSGIANELRDSRSARIAEIKELETELDNLYNESNN